MSSTTLYILMAVAALLLIVGAILLVWMLRKAAQRAAAADEPAPAQKPAEPAPLPLQHAAPPALAVTELSASFRSALDVLHNREPSSDYRYSLPWYLLIGASQSGKSALLSESSLAAEIVEQVTVEQGSGISWNFLEDGVVMDVNGDWSFGDGAHSTGTWRRLLQLIVRNRPERPLDGIIVAVSAADLIGPTALGSAPLIERASFLQQRLRQIQLQTGMRLPVYFVLTHCDRIEGFRELSKSLMPEEREQIFGWSNPYSPDLQFQSEWTDLALTNLRVGVEHRLSRLFAIDEYTRAHDALFLLPGNLLSLQPRLKIFLTRVLRSSSDVPMPFFRGLYCTGSTSEEAWRPLTPEAMLPVNLPRPEARYEWGSLSLTGMPEVTAQWSKPSAGIVFTRDLFLRKIFKERTLAVPLSDSFLTRNRTRQILQWTAIGLGGVLGLGMLLGYRRMQQTRDRLLPLLTNISVDMATRAGNGLPIADAAPRTASDDLIRAMLETRRGGVYSIFYPWSWGHPLDADMQLAMAPAFRLLVLERFERQLEQRAAEVTNLGQLIPDGQTAAISDSRAAVDLEQLPPYQRQRAFVDAIGELQQHINEYAQLSTPNGGAALQTVLRLDAYLNRRPEVVLPPDTTSPAFEQALAQASWQPFHYAARDQQDAALKFQDFTASLYVAAIEHNAIRVATDAVVASLRKLSGSSNATYDDLRTAQLAFQKLDAALAQPDLAWVGGDTLKMPPTLARVTLAPLGSSAYLPVTLRPLIEASAAESFRKMTDALDSATTPVSGPLLQVTAGKMELTDRAKEVQVGLGNLLDLAFVTARPGGPTIQNMGGSIDWNKGSLEQAVAMPAALQRYLAEDLDQAPAALRASLGRIARDRLGIAMESAVAEGELPGPRIPAQPSLDIDLVPAIQHFATAAPSLRAVMDSMRINGLNGPYSRVQAAANGQAASLLNSLDRAFNADEPYQLPTAGVDRWNGIDDPTEALFGSPDDLAGYLASQREHVRAYSNAADPLVQFLSANGAGGATARRWQGISASLKQYDAKRPGNSVQILESYMTTDLPKLRSARGCAAVRTVSSGATDYFQQVESQMQAQLRNRCVALRGTGQTTTYDALARKFNRDLAGKFPFASLQSSTLLEADPQQVAQFYQILVSNTDLMRGVSASGAARSFLESMMAAEPFFTALNNKPLPSIDFVPHFRTNRGREANGNQIAEWTLQVGSQIFRSSEPEKKGTWTVGQPVTLTLRWAKDAAFVPRDTSAGPLRANAQGVTYRFDDPWSLLRFIATLAAPPTEETDASGTGLLMLRVPEDGVSSLVKLQTSHVTEARVFLQLSLLVPGKTDAVAVPSLPLPDQAPGVKGSQP